MELKTYIVGFYVEGSTSRKIKRFKAEDARQARNMACNKYGNRIRFVGSRIPFGTGSLAFKGELLGWTETEEEPKLFIGLDPAAPGGGVSMAFTYIEESAVIDEVALEQLQTESEIESGNIWD